MTGAEVLLYTAIAGAAASAYGTYQQGRSAEQQAKAEAAWHTYNAQVAQREKEAEKQAALFEAQQHKRQANQLLKRQRALIGASGLDIEGSPLLVAEDTAAQLALENANIRSVGERRQTAYENQSILDTMRASASKTAAKSYKQAGTIGAGSSLLQGLAQAGYGYYTMKG